MNPHSQELADVRGTTTADAHSRRHIAVAFLKNVAAGDVKSAFDAYIAPNFRHHNPYFGGSAKALADAMAENARENPHKAIDVQNVLEDRDLVAVHFHVRHKPDDIGAAVVHIMRFHGDRIVEMWDVGQEIPGDSPNENGMF